MTATELMQAMAERLRRAEIGLAGVSFPPENYVAASPWAMVRLADLGGFSLSWRRAAEQIVNAPVDVVVYINYSGDFSRDAARLYPLIEQIVDLFTPGTGQVVSDLFPELAGEQIDHLYTGVGAAIRPVEIGEQQCVGLYLTFDPQFRRVPAAVAVKEARR